MPDTVKSPSKRAQFEAEVFAERIRIHPDTAEVVDPGLRQDAAIEYR